MNHLENSTLQEVSFYTAVISADLQKVNEIITTLAGNNSSYYMLEKPEAFTASELPLPVDWDRHASALTVFNSDVQITAEADGDGFLVNITGDGEIPAILNDAQSSTFYEHAWKRCSSYLLNRRPATKAWRSKNFRDISYIEYFAQIMELKENGMEKEDLMPVLVAGRINGLEGV